MVVPIEMEMKYLITGGGSGLTDEAAFEQILRETKTVDRINSFDVSSTTRKERVHRYFDTFGGDLEKSDITAYVGPVERSGSSVSARERENDYAVSVKFHTSSDGSREQYVFPLPKDTEFDKLDPNTLASFWDPLQTARRIGGGAPLQEVIRLYVRTHRFDLVQEDPRVEVALDQVRIEVPFLGQSKSFYELEVEKRDSGERVDVYDICRYFMEKYPKMLVLAPQPKWIKARQMVRGEEPEHKDPRDVPGLLVQQ